MDGCWIGIGVWTACHPVARRAISPSRFVCVCVSECLSACLHACVRAVVDFTCAGAPPPFWSGLSGWPPAKSSFLCRPVFSVGNRTRPRLSRIEEGLPAYYRARGDEGQSDSIFLLMDRFTLTSSTISGSMLSGIEEPEIQ